MPGGRPTKYKKEYCAMAEEFLAQGFSQDAFAGHIGVDPDTITNWKKVHPQFFGAIKRGSARSQLFWEKIGIAGAAGKIDGFNAASWIFNMKNRFAWKDARQLEGNLAIESKPDNVSETDSWIERVSTGGEATESKTPSTH